MQNRNVVVGVVALFGLLAVMMTVVSVKMSPIDRSDAAFELRDPYIRATMPSAQTAAAFLTLINRTGQDDRLVGAQSDIAAKVEFHRHEEDAAGVMRMSRIEGGIDIADGESHLFDRGGDHLMFTGLTAPLEQGATVNVTLTFENAGDVVIEIPVDLDR
ncbi:copper chaperone PCu(A)C [Sulfitobacter sp. HNIBRBA3233]|uniref:copper chaperone PCu(A)C n=1 Tax=Sulfitobacter marinivivus TaxID=3158558 RepID=UPI0032DFC33C